MHVHMRSRVKDGLIGSWQKLIQPLIEYALKTRELHVVGWTGLHNCRMLTSSAKPPLRKGIGVEGVGGAPAALLQLVGRRRNTGRLRRMSVESENYELANVFGGDKTTRSSTSRKVQDVYDDCRVECHGVDERKC